MRRMVEFNCIHRPDLCEKSVTRLGRSSKAPEQMTAECWRWHPRWNRLASSSTSCFGSSACLQSLSSVLCKTAYGLESPQDRLGGTHAEGAGHPDKLTVHGWRWYYENYLADHDEIFTGSTHHEYAFVGGPMVPPTNPKWRRPQSVI